MGVQNILQILGLDQDADFGEAATQFLNHVKNFTYMAQENPSAKNAVVEENALKTLYKHFFEYSSAWSAEEREKHAGEASHPNAIELKRKALASLGALQNNIINYSICYMRLHRSMGFINEEISAYSKHHKPNKEIRWTSDTGTILKRFKKEKEQLEASNRRFEQGLMILEKAEPLLQDVQKNATKILGKQTEDFMRSVRSALRTADFNKARKNLDRAAAAKKKFGTDKKTESIAIKAIQAKGKEFVDILEKEQENLTSREGKIFLSADELQVVIGAQEQEIEQKIAFIKKYHGPFMDYKLKQLKHLKDKLLVVGSPETLITLYIRLIRGIARPIAEIKDVREYEADVVEHVNYLLNGQFQEVSNIEERNVEIMEEFRGNVEEHAALENAA